MIEEKDILNQLRKELQVPDEITDQELWKCTHGTYTWAVTQLAMVMQDARDEMRAVFEEEMTAVIGTIRNVLKGRKDEK